jgi:hypothetical protein
MRSLRPYLERLPSDYWLALEMGLGLFLQDIRRREVSMREGASAAGDAAPAPAAVARPAPVDAEGLQQQVDRYWNSASWRLTGPVRNLLFKAAGREPPQRPLVYTAEQAAEAIDQVRNSTSWELAGVLRVAARLMSRLPKPRLPRPSLDQPPVELNLSEARG